MPDESPVDVGLHGEDIFAGGLRGDRGEVVLALPGGAGTKWVPAHASGADPAQVGVALVAERPPTGRAPGDEQCLVSDAGGDDEEPTRGLPRTVLTQTCRVDLGAADGCPVASGHLTVSAGRPGRGR